MSVLPLPARGEWFADARDGGRALRVSRHPELGCTVLSTWRGGTCVASTRLSAGDTARLIALLANGLAEQVATGDGQQPGGEQAGTGARGRAAVGLGEA